jgi:transposase InsO family protein
MSLAKPDGEKGEPRSVREFPFAGARMLRGLLAADGSKVGRRHITTLMRRIGIEAIYRRPNTSKPAPGHRIYPYLLRGLVIDRPNHVWATDITYIPMARGFVYLVAVMDWFARRILAWRLSNIRSCVVVTMLASSQCTAASAISANSTARKIDCPSPLAR